MAAVERTRASHASPKSTVGRSLPQSHQPPFQKTNVNSHRVRHQDSIQEAHRSSDAPVATAPSRPLTPPRPDREKTPPHPASGTSKTPSSHSIHYINGAGTPPTPSHPPTPETTPPRTTPSTYRPSLSQFGRVSSSSRADSFQTAREMISDSETVTPRRSTQSLRYPRRPRSRSRLASRSNSPARSSNASLSDDALTLTPSSETVRFLKPVRYEGNQDGHRKEDSGRLADDQWPEPSPRWSSSQTDDEEMHPIRGRRLRDRESNPREDPTSPASLEYFGITIGWVSTEEESSPRFSGLSKDSATIEVMIIDTPRPANPALRHTEKRSSLRSASSPLTQSERTSLETNPDCSHRLVHKAARITEQNRKSLASDTSIPASSAEGAKQQTFEIIPVVVIPERTSSLRSSPNVSRNPSKSGSRQSSQQRSSSGRKSRPPSLDLPRRKKRTLSDSITTSSQGSDSRGRIWSRPSIPARSSSLTAPTSRENSRATSLTSVTLQNHPPTDSPPEMEQRQRPTEQTTARLPSHHRGPSSGSQDPGDPLKTHSIWIGVEDLAGLHPPSLQFTPASIPSSSPGAVEIKEAKTVMFFPHNNESLLLVNPPTRPPPPPPLPVSTYHEPPRQLPQTPEDVSPQDVTPMASPLRNPRPPPQPPVPHDVHADLPTHEADPQPAAMNHDDPSVPSPRSPHGQAPSRRFGALRRPWGVRPRSDSFDRFVRSLNVKSAKNRKAGRDIDSHLHPFWRPRRFWDDSPSSAEFAEQEKEKAPPPEPEQIINNSLGMPQPRVIFDGPSSLAQRSPETKHPPPHTPPHPHPRRQNPSIPGGPHSRSRHSLVGSALFTPEALRSQTSLHQRRLLSASWWRLRLHSHSRSRPRPHSRPIRNLRWRLRRTIQDREEARHEARREKLKSKIGDAVLVGCSMQARELAHQP